ncbi:MAG: tetratricopeptide repeat protein [Acidobacteria bacterium]|nr:tetratricopeptide repeat protein [Acidobacteriota bacterium]
MRSAHYCIFSILLLGTGLVFAQDTGGRGGTPGNQPQSPNLQDQMRRDRSTLSGRVMPAAGEFQLPAMVTVTLTSFSGGFRQIQMVRSDGSFEFRGVPGGTLIISVESPGYEPSQETLDAGQNFLGGMRNLTLAMGGKLDQGDRPPANPNDKTVMAADLAIPKEAKKELQKALKESESKRPEKAIEHLNKAIQIYPNFYQAYNNLAVQYLRMGREQEAVKAFEHSIELNPNNATAYRNLALIYANGSDHLKTLEVLRKVIELEPNHVPSFMAMGQLYARLGQYVLGLNSFQSALRIDPANKEAYLWIGQCYIELGKTADALQYLDTFLTSEPKGERADRVRAVVTQLRKAG